MKTEDKISLNKKVLICMKVNVGLHDFMNISPKWGEPTTKWMFHSSFSNRNNIIITSSSTPCFLTNEITVISVPPCSHSSQKLNFLEHWALLIDFPSMNYNPISSLVIFQVAPSLMNSYLEIKIKWNSGVRTTFYSTWALVNTKAGTHWKLLKQTVTKPSQSLIFHWITEESDNSVPNADETLCLGTV